MLEIVARVDIAIMNLKALEKELFPLWGRHPVLLGLSTDSMKFTHNIERHLFSSI